jgi:hypothetical protein
MGEPRVGVNRERAVGELADRRFDRSSSAAGSSALQQQHTRRAPVSR